ncbi:hypothetical protein FB451DRAFT_1264938, partial [Mycena latifolia]
MPPRPAQTQVWALTQGWAARCVCSCTRSRWRDLDRASATCPQFPNTNPKPASAKVRGIDLHRKNPRTRYPRQWMLFACTRRSRSWWRARIQPHLRRRNPRAREQRRSILRCVRSIYIRNLIALQSAYAPVASEPAENYTSEYPGVKLHETACVKSANANANVDPGPRVGA